MRRRYHAVKALAASSLVHAAALSGMAAWVALHATTRPEFAGHRQTIHLVVTQSNPVWQPEPPTLDFNPSEAPVIVEPTKAQIAKRQYVYTPAWELVTTAVDRSPLPHVEFEPPPRAALSNADAPAIEHEQAVRRPNPQRMAAADAQNAAVITPPSIAGTSDRIPPDFSANAPPTYPALAIQRGWEGTVLLRLTIDREGSVERVEVARSSGYEILDGAAVGAVRNWKGMPAYDAGRPVETVEILPVRFRLNR